MTGVHRKGKARAPTSGTELIVPLEKLALASQDERLRMLATTILGLSSQDAEARLRRFGPNEPRRAAAKTHLKIFSDQFTHTLALLLWFASGLAFATDLPELGAAIVAVVAINGVFAFIQEYRAGKVVESLMRRVAVRSRVERDGFVQTIEAGRLVPGDVLHLSAGDIAPADCILLESNNLTADLSMLTGESYPVGRDPASELVEGSKDLSEVSSVLPAGSGIATGSATAVVWATGPNSSVGAISRLVEGAGGSSSVLEREVERLSRTTAVIAVTTGTATLCLAALLQETSFVTALTFGTGIVVALVPEGLLPTLSVALAIGAQHIARRGAGVRQLSAVEVVGSVTVICSDKTGTLTENALTVERFIGPSGTAAASREALVAAILCNDATVEGVEPAGDPLDVALWRWAEGEGIDPELEREVHPTLAREAFDARYRRMSVTCESESGSRTYVKGAPEAVLPLTTESAMAPVLAEAMESAASSGERVLLLAAGPQGQPLHLLGLVAFRDPPREAVPEAIAACRNAGIRVIMLTGDHPTTAGAIAAAIGLIEGEATVIEGRNIDSMSDRAICGWLSRNSVVARVNPEQKLRIVRALKQGGQIVVVTGDGVNDSPALEAADVGVAMGRKGTEVAKQAADIVLADDNFATIVAAIEEGRAIKANIRRFISYVFASNVAEMVPFLVYIIFPVPLPLAVIQALAIDIGTDLLPALALGVEPRSKDILLEPPEPPDQPLLSRALALRTFLFFGLIEALLGLAGFFLFYLNEGWRPGDAFEPFAAVSHEATTLTFLAIVGGQVGCLFAQRDGTLRQRLTLGTNPAIKGALAFEICLALLLVYLPGLNRMFSMAPVHAVWLLAIPSGAVVLTGLDQLRRMLSARTGGSEARS